MGSNTRGQHKIMWIYKEGKECSKCGANWLPFYASKFKSKKHKHLWGKIYVSSICQICKKEINNILHRKWRNKNKIKARKKYKKWEDKNHKYKIWYTKQRRKKKRLQSYYNGGDYGGM